MSKSFLLVANSPGELSALVKPLAEELSKRKNIRVILVLTPCQYTSGHEVEFAGQLKGIDEIVTAAEYKSWIFLNKKPKRLTVDKTGAVLFLGGDLAHAMLLARKLRFPAYAYLNERLAWKNSFKRLFVADQAGFLKFFKRLPKGKLKVTGNLMVDSVADLGKWQPQKNVVTFMPGSRKWEIDYMTPFYREVKALMEKEEPDLKFQIVSSPFVKARPISGMKMVAFEEIGNSELVVTIPGTNTALIAARGLPMVVVFPLNHPEVIPMEGLANLLGKVPVMGRAFKKWVANVVNKKTKFFALPNQKAGKEIVPEIRGEIEPLGVALKALLLLKDRAAREKMSAELVKSMGVPGAAKKIAEEIDAALA